MKLRLSYLAIFLFCIITNANSQTPTINKATQQSWSGGIAGSSGKNYSIDFTSFDTLWIDSIYIGGNCFALKNSNKMDDVFIWYQTGAKYSIIVKQYFRTHLITYPTSQHKEKTIKTECVIPKYEGKALLVYYINNKRFTINIDDFEHLPSVQYP